MGPLCSLVRRVPVRPCAPVVAGCGARGSCYIKGVRGHVSCGTCGAGAGCCDGAAMGWGDCGSGGVGCGKQLPPVVLESSASPPTVHTRDNRHNLHCSKVARFVCTLMLCFVRRGVTLGPMASAHPQPQTLLPQLRPLAQMMTQTTRWGSQVQPLRPARQRPCTLCERHWRLPHRVRKPLHAGSTGVQQPHIGKSAGPTALQARRPCKLFVRHWTLPWPHHPLPHQPQRGAALNPPRL